MGGLPAGIQSIQEQASANPTEVWHQVPHAIQFVYGAVDSADAVALDLWESEGVLPIPSEGQVVSLRGVDVRVVHVFVRFEVEGRTGKPSIFVTVRVKPADAQ